MVAPFTGAWIEISFTGNGDEVQALVAPFTGAWIEIEVPIKKGENRRCRTLHGCVD